MELFGPLQRCAAHKLRPGHVRPYTWTGYYVQTLSNSASRKQPTGYITTVVSDGCKVVSQHTVRFVQRRDYHATVFDFVSIPCNVLFAKFRAHQ